MSQEDEVETDRAINTAWSVHTALGDWTGRVDVKASIFLALESALMGVVIDASGKYGPFAEKALVTRFEHILYWAGTLLIGSSILMAVLVVTPQLRRWKSRKRGSEWKKNLVYFGHLRHWDPDDLRRELMERPEALGSLSRQLVRMSEISWRKHSWAQISMVLAVFGAITILWCLLLVR